jgi:aminomethyltransferase
MIKQSAFFDFFNRRENQGFGDFLEQSNEEEHYINWNEFLLPRDYGDPREEYQAIRNSCALFDVSPIRKFAISGPSAGHFLDHLLTRPVSDAAPMRGIYVAYCNADGSLKDDSILYKFTDEDYLLMPSDIDHSPHFETLRERLQIVEADLAIVDCTDSWVGVAVQGPLSATVLQQMGFDDIAQLKPFEVRDYEFSTGSMRVARMGFTADLGYECWFKPEIQDDFERAIEALRNTMGIALPGYGLTALEACRLEGGLVVAGWDFSTELDYAPGFERSPHEVGLGWLVNLDAVDFVGRDALREQCETGHRYCLRSLTIDDGRKPEDDVELYGIVDGAEQQVGSINCSAWSWGLEKMVGNASIKSAYADLDRAWVMCGDERLQVRLDRGAPQNLERRNQVPAYIEERGV